MAAHVDSSESRQFTSRDVLAMIFRRKWVILSIFVVTLAMGVSASLKTTSEYQAVSKVLIRRAEASSFVKAKTPYLGLEEEMNTEIEILRSAAVLERALALIEREVADLSEEEKVALFPPEDPNESWALPTTTWIRKNLQGEPVERSNVIMIRFRHTNAATARMLADALATAYVNERISVRRNPNLEGFFHDRTAGLRDRLLDLRTELGQLQIEAGIYDQDWQQRLNLGTLDQLRTDLLRTQVRRETLESRLAQIRRRVREEPQLLVPDAEFDETITFQDLRGRLIDKQTKLAELKGRYLPDHPLVKQMEDEVAFIEGNLRAEVDNRIAMMESEIDGLRAQELATGNAISDILDEMNRIPRYSPMIRQIEREINNTAELYELVGTKMVDTQISETEDQRMVNAKVLSPATVSLSFVQQRKSLFALFAALLGLSLGLGLAFLLEGLDHTLRTPDDVELNLGVPLLGSIPNLKPALRR